MHQPAWLSTVSTWESLSEDFAWEQIVFGLATSAEESVALGSPQLTDKMC